METLETGDLVSSYLSRIAEERGLDNALAAAMRDLGELRRLADLVKTIPQPLEGGAR